MGSEALHYTPGELMVAVAAREIHDGEVVFVGMRLPILAFCLARSTHAPSAIGLFENGVVRDSPARDFVVTISDGPNVAGALWCTEMRDIMGLLQAGRVDLGFIGGAQIDRFGNLNTGYVGPPDRLTRLPGSGGGGDIACLARRHVIIMTHQRRRFVERVDYVTSPGFGEGGDWRGRVGLPGGGPAAVITTLGVFRFDPATREMALASTHPGVTVAQVRAQTGWSLACAPPVTETPAPTAEELAVIRRFDPEGFWTRERG
jgi:glutaconate CoA-transferase subunit B